MVWRILLFVLSVTTIATNHVLVILDNANILDTHSQFLELLRAKYNVELSYVFGKEKIELKNYDQFRYQHIIVMCTSETCKHCLYHREQKPNQNQ